MWKIFIIILSVSFLISPQLVKAVVFVPTGEIIITTNTLSDEGVFNYSLYQGDYEVENWQTHTTHDTGTYHIKYLAAFPSKYRIVQELIPQTSTTVECSSSYGGSLVNSVANQVDIDLAAEDVVNCVFTNKPDTYNNSVLVIPGILGSEIYKETEKLWLDVNRLLVTNNDRFLDPLSYTNDNSPLDFSLSIGQIVAKPSLTFDYSTALINSLVVEGYVDGVDLFTFPYDWRKDVREVAIHELKDKIDALVPPGSGKKLDVVAHSQGGLVIKYLLYFYPEYKSRMGKLIFVGTPHLGAPKAAKALLYGDAMGVNFLGLGLDPQEIKRIGQNMPSVYNLLPSEQYFNHVTTGYLGTVEKPGLFGGAEKVHIYDYPETKQALKDKSLNESLLGQAEDLHHTEYDNYNFIGSGIEAYNIVGCQEATISRVLSRSNGKFRIEYGPGDGTVPVISASNVGVGNTYYALDTDHGTMLTGQSTRQQIVGILKGETGPATNDITKNGENCEFNGREVSVHSPVDLHIYDEHNNHVGPTSSGSFDYNIPGVQYDVLEDQKFAFLPAGHTYRLELPATANGTFDLYSDIIDGGRVTSSSYYHEIPIAAVSKGFLDLTAANNEPIKLDTNGDGAAEKAYVPTAVLTGSKVQDLVAPTTAAMLGGAKGQENFYRSNVALKLTATDVSQEGVSAAGVLETKYKLDSNQWLPYTQQVVTTEEGKHVLQFYSTDKAGNSEVVQTVEFTIDKTAPEVVVQWKESVKDLVFTGVDLLTQAPTIFDEGNKVTVKDQAGNSIVLTFAQKNRRSAFGAELTGIAYNGVAVAVTGNKFLYAWKFNKQGVLELLSQTLASKKNYAILGLYDGKKTSIVGIDQNGIVNKKITGLVSLKVQTSKGVLSWSY